MVGYIPHIPQKCTAVQWWPVGHGRQCQPHNNKILICPPHKISLAAHCLRKLKSFGRHMSVQEGGREALSTQKIYFQHSHSLTAPTVAHPTHFSRSSPPTTQKIRFSRARSLPKAQWHKEQALAENIIFGGHLQANTNRRVGICTIYYL